MSEEIIFTKVNKLLEGTGYTPRIKNLSDLRNFVFDKSNSRYTVYDDIEELYDLLIVGQGIW